MPSALSKEDINQRLKSLPEWKLDDNELVRIKSFSTYKDALNFVYKLGLSAVEHDHHPDIIMNYKKVTIRFSTHSAGGITPLDFDMAGVAEKLVR